MIDRGQNEKRRIEATIQTVAMAQELYAQAAPVEHAALRRAQVENNVVDAQLILKRVFSPMSRRRSPGGGRRTGSPPTRLLSTGAPAMRAPPPPNALAGSARSVPRRAAVSRDTAQARWGFRRRRGDARRNVAPVQRGCGAFPSVVWFPPQFPRNPSREKLPSLAPCSLIAFGLLAPPSPTI